MRSEVRRWHVPALEQVHHRRHGQEWIPHWHSEWSVGAIVRGECLCSIAGQPFRARTGDVLAIAPGTVHTGALAAPDGTEGVLVVMLYVPPEWFAQAGLSAPKTSGRVYSSDVTTAAAGLLSPDDAEHWLRVALAVLDAGLTRPASETHPTPAARSLLTRFQDGILDGEVSVAALAGRCAVSREQLHRVVRRWTGMSPADYLRALRVNRAREMLLDGEPPAAVAAACGFTDQAHLTRSFRRSFGYTPGDLLAASGSGHAISAR